LAIIILLLSVVSVDGKTYKVFLVRGNVSVVKNRNLTPVKEGMVIDESTFVKMDKHSTLTLMDERKRRLPSVNGVREGKLIKILKSDNIKILYYLKDMWDFITGKSASDFGVSIDKDKNVNINGVFSRGEGSVELVDDNAIQVLMLKQIIEEAIRDE
jgi:hypothetical protein